MVAANFSLVILCSVRVVTYVWIHLLFVLFFIALLYSFDVSMLGSFNYLKKIKEFIC